MGIFASKFDPETDLLDLKGKVAVVTGGNAGIGYWTVLGLRRRGAKVYLGARSEEKARAAVEQMDVEEGLGEVVIFSIDLEHPSSAKAAALWIMEREARLDILVNNAGRIPSPPYVLNKEGMSITMVTNFLSPFLFTCTISPLLEAAAKEPGSDVRVITVSSEMHALVSNPKYDSIEAFNQTLGSETSYYGAVKRYGLSKLAGVLHSQEMQRRYNAENIPITCISLHPGRVRTDTAISDVAKLPIAMIGQIFMRWTFYTPEQGSYTTLFAAASKTVGEDREKYKAAWLEPYDKIGRPGPLAKDEVLANTLWKTSVDILQDVYKIEV